MSVLTEKAAVMLMLNGFVFWEARLVAELGHGPPEAENPLDVYLRVASTQVDAERFPALRRAVDAGIFEDESRDTDFSFGLERVLDGVERLVDQRAA
jgi:hypothetical protein